MNFSISKPNLNGHVIIKVKQSDQEFGQDIDQACGYIMFRPLPHIIELTSISCNCPSIRGKCMKILLGKMIDYCISRHDANDDMRVELMVEPDEDFLRDKRISSKIGSKMSPKMSPKTALKTHYRKFGFENDPSEPALTEYMVSTIGQIKQNIRYTKIPRFSRTRSKVSVKSAKVSATRKTRSRIPVYREPMV